MSTSLLRSRDFRLLAGAVGISALGDWLAAIPLILRVEEMTDSGIAVSGPPHLPVGAERGPGRARRHPRRPDRDEPAPRPVSLVQTGVAVALAFTGSLPAIFVLTAALGVGFAISQACEFALVPAVSGSADVRQANGYVETSRYAGFVVGPAVGGLLSATGGFSAAMLVNAASFVVVAFASVALRTRRHPERRGRRRDAHATASSSCSATGARARDERRLCLAPLHVRLDPRRSSSSRTSSGSGMPPSASCSARGRSG